MKMFKYISSSILLSVLLLLAACEDGNDFGDGYTATTDDVAKPVSVQGYINLSETSHTFDASAQNWSTAYSANVDFSISNSASWLTVEKSSTGGGTTRASSGYLVFTVEENTETTSRTTEVKLIGDNVTTTVTITQSETSYISVSTTSVTFDATAQTKTITYSANTNFTVSIENVGTTRASNSWSNSWLTVETNTNGTIAFTVTENTSSSERSARVVLTGTNGTSASATITVTQEGKANTGTGDGSRANPYDCTAAINLVQSLGANVQSGDIYLKGTISSISDVSPQYGNATFTITDGTSSFYVYRCLYLGNTKFTREDQIKVGDEVIIYGKVVYYNGSTPETVQGNSYIYSINGSTSATDVNATPFGDDTNWD